MTHWQVALIVEPMTHCQVKGTGHGTLWHIARWKTLVVVPYATLLGERHWSWYHMPHCQVKDTDHGTVWHISRWKALIVHGIVWHILTQDYVGKECKISTNSETIKVITTMYKYSTTIMFLCRSEMQDGYHHMSQFHILVEYIAQDA